MKRLLFLTTMFLCTLLTFAQFCGTVSDSQGVKYTANDDASTCYVSGHEGSYSSEIVFPEEYQGRTVTSIGERAFYECTGLTSVTFGNGVTSIGDRAFRYCSGLTSIEIPNSVTSIGHCAFYECTGLTSVTIGNSVTSIGQHVFQGCTGLTSIEIPNSVTSIGDGAFSGCSSLTSVTIGNSVTSIGIRAVDGCSGLTSVVVSSGNAKYDSRDNCNAIIETASNTLILGCKNTVIPNSVTSIGQYAFCGCSGLTSVVIPNSVTSIGMYAFHECSGLTSVEIPNSVTSIGERAFFDCSGLTSIEIPNSVTSIGHSAFGGCSSLTSVTIPNSVTRIGNSAFQNCSGLTSMVVSSGNTEYDSRNNCNAIIETATNTLITSCKNTVIPNSVTSIGVCAFHNCSGLTSIEIPNSVTSIGERAFRGCSGLTSIEIPNSVTSIGMYAFGDCSGLTSVTIGNSVTSIGHSAFGGCSSLTSIEIPNSVTSIGDGAFSGCSSLTLVTIPNSVTSIGGNAFLKCSSLTSIEIPNSVTSIGYSAFSGCSGLTEVTIPNSVTSIGYGAFRYCSGLTSVTVKNENPVEIESETFSNRANATLYVPAGSKEAYKAANYWKDFKEIIEMDIQPIDTGETVDFGSDIDGDTDLDGNIVGDIYYVISNDDGGYDVAEGCIVVTTPTDDSTIDGQDIFGEDFQNNYTGIVLKVPAGRGTITVEAQTIGTMVLKVKIGTAAPVTMELDGRLKVSFPYDVTEPTYVYIYGGSNASAAPDMAGSAAGGELKLYGIEVAPGATGIEPTPAPSPRDGKWYTLNGRCIANGQWKMDNGQLPKGVYIVNGHKVVIK